MGRGARYNVRIEDHMTAKQEAKGSNYIAGCKGKSKHPTKYLASLAAKEFQHQTGDKMYSYKCECGFYHIGHRR